MEQDHARFDGGIPENIDIAGFTISSDRVIGAAATTLGAGGMINTYRKYSGKKPPALNIKDANTFLLSIQLFLGGIATMATDDAIMDP